MHLDLDVLVILSAQSLMLQTNMATRHHEWLLLEFTAISLISSCMMLRWLANVVKRAVRILLIVLVID